MFNVLTFISVSADSDTTGKSSKKSHIYLKVAEKHCSITKTTIFFFTGNNGNSLALGLGIGLTRKFQLHPFTVDQECKEIMLTQIRSLCPQNKNMGS